MLRTTSLCNAAALESLERRVLFAAAASAGPLDLSDVEFRTIDGTGNNVASPTQGAARTTQIRFGYGAAFPDGYGDAIVTDPQRPNPRTISNALHAQGESVVSDRMLTDWIFQWGQWITHDIDLTLTGAQYNTLYTGETGDFSIPILDPNDPLGPRPIPFNRSEYDPTTGTPDPVPETTRLNRREVVNSVTSYIDASMVYGSDAERAAALRTFKHGKLKTSAGGELLPLNTDGLDNADEFGAGEALFLAGDRRANEQANLTAVHTLFVREHNRLADRIHRLYPKLKDEQIYQLARRIVGAEMQIITYEEYLPAMLGTLAPDPNNATYDAELDASVTNSFAHAVFRFGHSQISSETLLVNGAGRTVDTLSIADAFFNPDILKDDPDKVGLMLKGLASQLGQENDLLLVDGVRNMLFGPPGAGGLDLAALDIQRGRDHGLPDYNNLRARYGLEEVTSFAEISSDPAIQAKLEELFGSVDNIDPFVGALAEDHVSGSSAGELIHAVVGNQFTRLRDGDRFFYTQDVLLNSEAVERIIDLDSLTLSQVIQWNTDIDNIQKNVFVYDVELTGRIFYDNDADARPDRREWGMRNVTVQLIDESGAVIDTATTGRDGRYAFEGVQLGEFTIRPVIETRGMRFTTPATVTIDVTANTDLDDVNFGLREARRQQRFERGASVAEGSDARSTLADLEDLPRA